MERRQGLCPCALGVREEQGLWPGTLITTVTDTYGRISMHGVRRELLVQQACSLGIELREVPIPAGCSNDLYEQRVASALDDLPDVECVACGDLFLEDVRAYRERQLAAVGKQALFPLWGRDTDALARLFVQSGFQAILVCVDPAKLDPSFAGRSFDAGLLEDLPKGVDPCGENGEFHTFVYDGPIFTSPISCQTGEVVARDGFVFCDVL